MNRRGWTGVILLAALAGCSPKPDVAAKSLAEAEGPVYIDAVASEEERTLLQDLIREADAILTSDTFKTNLLSLQGIYPKIFANPALTDASPERILKILRLQEPDTHRIRVPVALVGSEAYNDGSGNFNYTARTGSTHWNGEAPVGSMTLGRVNTFRYKETDLVNKSCAINTMSHEITHTISRVSGKYIFAIQDTTIAGRPDKTTPLASDLVGSVAQCTWLQKKNRIQPSGVAECVKVFGTQNFNNMRCPEFSAGQDVVERPGLAPPAPPR